MWLQGKLTLQLIGFILIYYPYIYLLAFNGYRASSYPTLTCRSRAICPQAQRRVDL